MKTLVSNYTFSAATHQVTFSDVFPSSLSNVLLITNVTDGIIIYNFADSSTGGSLSSKTLTLTYDTSSMSDTDLLQIFIDVPNTDFEELTDILKFGIVEIVRQLQSIRNDGGMADPNGRVRIAIESGSVGISSNSTLTNVTNLANIGGYSAAMQVFSGGNSAAKELRNRLVTS